MSEQQRTPDVHQDRVPYRFGTTFCARCNRQLPRFTHMCPFCGSWEIGFELRGFGAGRFVLSILVSALAILGGTTAAIKMYGSTPAPTASDVTMRILLICFSLGIAFAGVLIIVMSFFLLTRTKPKIKSWKK